ncbi:MAG: tRNA pseudouridine(13) synthase TruD, partial [Candidatus Aenigmarchaeota archaeon]|nr:tRNA pseudouridine(13) synthase TruD [Candidatus Aenigmarchaeota archaeon]
MVMKIRAKIKQVPEDFCVTEILPDKRHSDALDAGSYLQEGQCVYCTLKKHDMDQFHAVSIIASELDIPSRNIAICGTKDKRAVTVQRVSIKGCTEEKIQACNLSNPALACLGRGAELHIGDLYGNRFEIVLRDVSSRQSEIEACLDEIKANSRFPNSFGEQRFGAKRPVSHIVGKHVIKKDFRNAVLDYITLVFPEEAEKIKEARVVAKRDLKGSLELFPKSSYYERVMILHLIDNPGD